jgi:inorganic triphosphatase YgiF
MSEIQLRFLIDERAPRRLRARLRSLHLLAGNPRTRALRSIYYDTPGHALQRAGISLRLRRDGRRWMQTLKILSGLNGGRSDVARFECPAPGGRLRIEAIPDATLRAKVLHLAGSNSLGPVCESSVKRSLSGLALPDGTRAELAIDVGELRAAERSAELREAEIQLIEGDIGALYDLVQDLFPEGGLRFSLHSKGDRGYRLAERGTVEFATEPRTAAAIPLRPQQTAEQAARDVLRECFEQIAANIDVLRTTDDPEGPHQLRIGLRRLRSAFSVFSPAIKSPELVRLGQEARWLGQEVGVLRDLDVVIIDILEPEARAHRSEPGFSVLRDAVVARNTEIRDHVRALLESQKTRAFLIDLARFIETRGWLVIEDIEQTSRLAAPVTDLARRALNNRWEAVARRATGIDDLEIEERHDLRKELKKLRYAVEFLAPLFPKRRVAPFVKRLKKLQTIFGDLNDAAMAEALFSGENAPGAGDLAAQRASGWVIGARLAKAEYTWENARVLWKGLNATKAFWK